MRVASPVFAFLLVALLAVAARDTYAAGKSGPPQPLPEVPDSSRQLIPLPFFSKVGFQTGYVETKELDPGVDFGALLSKDVYHDFFEVTATFHLWGATNDSLDVATAGVDLNFAYKIPIRWGWYAYAGFVLGYGYVHTEKNTVSQEIPADYSFNRNEFQRFITAGAEFDIHSNRTLFVQLKYGVTDLSREIHLSAGINFYTKYKKFMPWLAPPLMRD
ncbi:MAG: porin family protein [Candidatus Latescibacterota bacterium]